MVGGKGSVDGKGSGRFIILRTVSQVPYDERDRNPARFFAPPRPGLWIEIEPHPRPPRLALDGPVHPQACDGDAAQGGQAMEGAVLGFHAEVLVPEIASRVEEAYDFPRRLVDAGLLIRLEEVAGPARQGQVGLVVGAAPRRGRDVFDLGTAG